MGNICELCGHSKDPGIFTDEIELPEGFKHRSDMI